MVNGESGMANWGKYYQNNEGSEHIALFEVCKFSSDKS